MVNGIYHGRKLKSAGDFKLTTKARRVDFVDFFLFILERNLRNHFENIFLEREVEYQILSQIFEVSFQGNYYKRYYYLNSCLNTSFQLIIIMMIHQIT